MKTYREGLVDAKAKRRGIEEQRSPGKRKKIAKPWRVMVKTKHWREYCLHRCSTRELAEQLMAKAVRTYYSDAKLWIDGPEK